MATAKYIDLGFTIADAEYPALAFGRGELTLMFRDYRGDNIRVVFRDVWWFEWLDEVPDDDQIPGELWDGTAIVHESDWIPTTAPKSCKHSRLNFNECGARLNVACESVETNPA